MGRVPLRKVTSRRFAALTLAAIAVGIIAMLMAASYAPSGTALPSTPAVVAKKLRWSYEIYLRPLPAGTRPKVGQSAAEATALKEFDRPLTSNVSAFAAVVTDKEWSKRQPNGTMRLQISNRPMWVVLLPHFSMMGYHGMTLCVFVDADTGHYRDGVTIWLR